MTIFYYALYIILTTQKENEMGMDVHGLKGKEQDKQAYFQNSSWNWRPLWAYCYHIADDLISEELYKSGHYNDGAGLDADDSKKLGERLMKYIADGRAMQFQEDYQKDSDYPFDVEIVEEFALFCIESGGFKIC